MLPLRIEDVVLLEHFGDNWNGRVYRVRNHKNESLRAGLGNLCGEITNDASVDLASDQVSVVVNMGKGWWAEAP